MTARLQSPGALALGLVAAKLRPEQEALMALWRWRQGIKDHRHASQHRAAHARGWRRLRGMYR